MISSKFLGNAFQRFVPLFSVIILFWSCGDTKQSNKDLHQAFELHEEAVKLRNQAKDEIVKLKANKDSVFVATHAEDLNVISSALDTWDEELVEVPGFEHEHDHGDHDHSEHDHSGHDHEDHGDHDHGDHDHHHHHAEQELTPKQHLEVQQHLLEEIKGIAAKIKAIKG